MDFEKLKITRNKMNAFANELGLAITHIEIGHAKAEMDIQPNHLNPIGSVHGGCLFTVADVVCGAAASSYGDRITTLDSSFHYLRPGLNTTKLLGEASIIKHGKRVSVFQATVTDQDGTVLSTGTFTFMSL